MFDLMQFDYQEDFSADEISGLLLAIDPRLLGQTISWQTVEPLWRRIESDYSRACEATKMVFVMHGEIEVEEKLKTIGLGLFSIGLQNSIDNYSWMKDPKVVLDWIDSPNSQLDRQRFGRAAIVQWLTQSNLKSKYDFGQLDSSDQQIGPTGAWPWGTHTTQDLDDLKAAALHWWSNYSPADPASAPKNENVMNWLMQERGTVKAKAENIASMLRPKDLKSGPRVRHATKK